MMVVVVLPLDQDFAAIDFSFRTTMSVFRCTSWSLRDAISRSLLSRISCILAIDCASFDAAAVDCSCIMTTFVVNCSSFCFIETITWSLLSRSTIGPAATVDVLFREDCGPALEKVPF
jgi:hypothetical protein